MAVYTLQNPYHGVNAHYNSYIQRPGGGKDDNPPNQWVSFHNAFVTLFAVALNDILPATYVASNDQSLQVVTEYWDAAPEKATRRPDTSIYGSFSGMLAAHAITEAEEIRVEDTINHEDTQLDAVLIYDTKTRLDSQFGKVVTRIELLSPSNVRESGERAYRYARAQTLYSKTVLIEIDLLHQTPFMLPNRPVYPDAAHTFAYNIYVNDPRPTLETGQTRIHKFSVDAPLPKIDIPLAGDEILPFELDPVYQYTFTSGRRGTRLDYSQPPMRFETYSADDQARILAVMERAKTLLQAE